MDVINSCAMKCIAMGMSVIPIGDNKLPAIKWKEHISRPLDAWTFHGCNMGIVTGEINDIVVVDCDTRHSSLMWLSTMPKTPLMVRSARGMHFYYRHPGQYVKSAAHLTTFGFPYDIKGDRSYVLSPPSVRKGHKYKFVTHEGNPNGKWIKPDLLPTFDVSWRPESSSRLYQVSNDKEIYNVRRYIDRICASEGERDRVTFRVAKTVRESGASESEAVAIVVEWHMRNCTPPWDVMEVAEKVKRVYSGA